MAFASNTGNVKKVMHTQFVYIALNYDSVMSVISECPKCANHLSFASQCWRIVDSSGNVTHLVHNFPTIITQHLLKFLSKQIDLLEETLQTIRINAPIL